MELLYSFMAFCIAIESGLAAKCMTPRDARFMVPKEKVPDDWKNSSMWHTGDYFPAPNNHARTGILLTNEDNAARVWWVKDSQSDLYMFLTKDEPRSILCTLIGAGLQVGWSPVTTEVRRSGYCHWIVDVNPEDPSLFQIRNHELSTIPDIGPVYLNRTGLYFDYASNSINDPANSVEEKWKWWRWQTDGSADMHDLSALPDQCELGESGIPLFMEEEVTGEGVLGRSSVGGRKRRRRRYKFMRQDSFARCSQYWFLHGRKCYRIFTAPGLQQSRTEKVCRLLKARVVLPESVEENRYIRALARSYAPGRKFWIRARVPDIVMNPRRTDFKDRGETLTFSRIRATRRIMNTQKCAQIMPRKSALWWPSSCYDSSAHVLCERDADVAEQPGSLKCGKIQTKHIDNLMASEYFGEQAFRVVGGENAEAEQFPWQAAIRLRRPERADGLDVFHFCGGALIDLQWVVSAAHCFATRNPSEFIVRLGDLNNAVVDGTEQEFDIQELIVHSEYRSVPSHRNDIALIKLSRKAALNDTVQPVCLPTPRFTIRPDGERCQVSGWGLTDLKKGQASAAKVLQWVTVPTMPDALCSERYNRRTEYFVEEKMFCAGHRRGGKDSCSGDSGGPYVCRNKDDGRYALAGVVSFGIGCAHKVYPGVYTNVRNYIPWIKEQVAASGDFDLLSALIPT